MFSLWHVAGIPRDKPILSKSSVPEGKTLYKCLKEDDVRIGQRAVKKMVVSSQKNEE